MQGKYFPINAEIPKFEGEAASMLNQLSDIEYIVITPRHPLYRAELELRERVLRRPLGMTLKTSPQTETDSIHFLALLQGTVVGCILLTPLPGFAARLRQAAVDERLRNRGIGRGLLNNAEEFARAEGITRIMLHGRLTAKSFYERSGYRSDGDQFLEMGIPHIRMCKAL